MEKRCFIKLGKHTVGHTQQDRYNVHNGKIKQDTGAMGFKDQLGSENKEGVKPGMLFLLRFQNINSSNKPLDSFYKFPLDHCMD